MSTSNLSLTYLASLAVVMASLMQTFLLQAGDSPDLWFRRNVPGLSADLHSVAFGNGQFVAVGADSTVVRSTDGSQWTPGSAGNFGSLARVRFLNGQFVAMGPAHVILFSSDAITWDARSFPGNVVTDMAYGNGVYVAATDLDPYYSTDGLQWLPIAERDPGSLPWVTPNSAELVSVSFAEGRFVGLRRYHPKVLLLNAEFINSTNGLDWTLGPALYLPVDTGKGTMEYGLGLFAFAAQTPGVMGLQLSEDGSLWNCVGCNQGLTPSSHELGAAFSSTVGLRVTANLGFSGFEPRVDSTPNGVDWAPSLKFPSPIEDPSPSYYDPLRGLPRAVAAGAGGFVVVGDGGYIIHSGPGGGAPSIVRQPAEVRVAVGQAATFKVQASGASPLSYAWYHNDQVIVGATTDTYTVPEVRTSDAGAYKVVITNPLGSVTSDTVQLKVAFLRIKMYAGVELDGIIGRTYRIEATEIQGTPNWQVVADVVLPSSHYVWIDSNSPDHGTRLYRATELTP